MEDGYKVEIYSKEDGHMLAEHDNATNICIDLDQGIISFSCEEQEFTYTGISETHVKM